MHGSFPKVAEGEAEDLLVGEVRGVDLGEGLVHLPRLEAKSAERLPHLLEARRVVLRLLLPGFAREVALEVEDDLARGLRADPRELPEIGGVPRLDRAVEPVRGRLAERPEGGPRPDPLHRAKEEEGLLLRLRREAA